MTKKQLVFMLIYFGALFGLAIFSPDAWILRKMIP